MIFKNKYKLIGKFKNKIEAIKVFRGKSLVYQKIQPEKYCYIEPDISVLPSTEAIIPISILSNTDWTITIND